MTRDFAVHGEADERAAILPIADYVNHKNGRETVNLIEIEDGSYEIQAIYPLEPGTEITVMYGKLSNSGLVNYWGFVMPDNKLDTVTLDVAITANAPLAAEKQRVLLEHSDRLTMRPKEADSALSLLRILSSDAPEIRPFFFRYLPPKSNSVANYL